MIVCSRCGEENPDRARFCLNCANPLVADAPTAETRRTVTILFADVVNSTGRGETTDPESTRHMLARYFDLMRSAAEKHGGTVEKFIGDAVMAVFGIPTLHEDDALRAVRAAADMIAALDALNAELSGSGWRPIAVRVGVNTGEVVTGDPKVGQTLVTGDAVNVAARLEQAAAPGEVLLGGSTYQLVRHGVVAEPVPPLELKGKADAVPAYRLTSVSSDGAAGRRHDTPLIARDRELRLLTEAFERADEDQACQLFTLLGAAGVGKSRLVHEFLTKVRGDAQVMRARCLPYGDGITYWPIVELVQGAAGITSSDGPAEAVGKLETFLGSVDGRAEIVERVSVAIGLSDEMIAGDEIFWGVRKLFEAIAARQPLIVVIDDLHWAEATLLDLVEHIAELSRDAPILLLAIARPELLDIRPHWGGGKLNATTILLEPLSADQSLALVTNLLGDRELARELQERVGETTEGNPLFVEELVAMLIDQGIIRRTADGWTTDEALDRFSVPPTVSALVAARLDRLEAPERDLVGRASVVGKVFQRAAITELSPPEHRPELGKRLMTLVRKELVRPDPSTTVGEEAFRFRHILVRDAAYGSLPKEQRADLHARFATWLEAIAGERLHEYEEVIGHHLEQAHANRAELGLDDELTRDLGARAAAHLRAAGFRAARRRDLGAAVGLLTRAVPLIDDDRTRAEVLIVLADAVAENGEFARGLEVYDQARAVATRAGDELLAMRAQLEALSWAQANDPDVSDEPIVDLADELQRRAEAAGDLQAAITSHLARGGVYLGRCRWADQLAELAAASRLAEQLDDERLQRIVAGETVNALRYGPVPVLEALERIDAITAMSANPDALRGTAAPLRAMRGAFDEARREVALTTAFFRDRGVVGRVGTMGLPAGRVERLAGDLHAAERVYDESIEILGAAGETGVLSTLAAERALIRYRLGRIDAALESIRLAERTGAPHDIATQAWWRLVAAMIAADRGRSDEARTRIDEAVSLAEPTDFSELRADVFEALAHVRSTEGRDAEAHDALGRALAEHESKGNEVEAARVRGLLEEEGAAR